MWSAWKFKREVADMSSVAVFRKIRRNARDYGLKTCAAKMLAAGASVVYERRVYRLYRIGVQSKDWYWPQSQSFRFRLLELQDRNAIRQIEKLADCVEGMIEPTLASGGLCCVVYDGPRVIGFNLINLQQMNIPLIKLHRPLRHGDAWSEHIAVDKLYRKLGLAIQIRWCVLAELKRRGYRYLYGGTLVSNIASLRLTRAVGFRELVDITYHQFLGRRNYKVKRVRP